jgi:hypothetical protein
MDSNDKTPSKPMPAGLVPFTTSDMAAAYQHFLPLIQQMPDEDVSNRRGNVLLARHNIERGIKSIQPHLATIPGQLPRISLPAILELPALALGLVHADDRVPHTASTGEIDEAYSRVGPLRKLTLQYLEVAAELGLVPKTRVSGIRAGKGKLDNSRDCVSIASIFREFEQALNNKHPFAPEVIEELATTGTWLVQALTPTGGVKAPVVRDSAALIRDRFWIMVEQRHDDLRTVGVALFGIKQVDEHVPPLLSRTAAKLLRPSSGSEPETPSSPSDS